MEGKYEYRDWRILIGYNTLSARGITDPGVFIAAVPPVRFEPPEGKVRLVAQRRDMDTAEAQEHADNAQLHDVYGVIDAAEENGELGEFAWT